MTQLSSKVARRRAILVSALLATGLFPTGMGAAATPTAAASATSWTDQAIAWAVQRLGAVPEGLREQGGRVAGELVRILVVPAREIAGAALVGSALGAAAGLVAGLLLAFLTARWMRAHGALGCLWTLLFVPCAVLGAAYGGLWLGGSRAFAAAVGDELLLERSAVTVALVASSGGRGDLAGAARDLARDLASVDGAARRRLREGTEALGAAGATARLGAVLLAPERLDGVLSAFAAGPVPSPAILLAFARGPAALAALPAAERERARSLAGRTAPLRRQVVAAVRMTALPNLLAGLALIAGPVFLALVIGLFVRLLGVGGPPGGEDPGTST